MLLIFYTRNIPQKINNCRNTNYARQNIILLYKYYKIAISSLIFQTLKKEVLILLLLGNLCYQTALWYWIWIGWIWCFNVAYDLKECGTEEKIILKIVASYTCTLKSGYWRWLFNARFFMVKKYAYVINTRFSAI